MNKLIRFLFPDRELLVTTINMAWPAVLESFFVAFAGLVDSYMVSSMGSAAVASVGLTTQPKLMGLAVFFASNVSVSALVARRLGEKKRDDANRIAMTAFLSVMILSVLMSVIFVAFASPIIDFCGSTEETHAGAVAYYRIIMGGMFFNCLLMIINAAQRGSGNTKITMTTNLISNGLNIVLNYLLIGGHFGFPALGIQGAALATVLGTVAGCAVSILSIRKDTTFISIPYMLREKLRPSLRSLKQLIHVGYGIFFEQLLMRVGFMATALMAADQGTWSMAAHQVAMNLLSLSFSFGDGLQSAAVALIGRSLGAAKPDEAKKYGATCRRIGAIISVMLSVLFFFGGTPLFRLYFEEPEIVKIGTYLVYIIIFVVIFQVSQVIYMGCLRGAGDTLYTAIVSTISVTLIRTGISYFFGYTLGLGIEGIWFGILADQMGRYICASIRFRQGKWVKIRI